MTETRPIIATAHMDNAAFRRLDALRERHFPEERNYLSAHLTLFHHLPGGDPMGLIATVKEAVADTVFLDGQVTEVMSLGRGAAFKVEVPGLKALRGRIAEAFEGQLTEQDQGGFRPHVTVQNKVSKEEAQATLADLRSSFTPFGVTVTGIDLWFYNAGPWEFLTEVPLNP